MKAMCKIDKLTLHTYSGESITIYNNKFYKVADMYNTRFYFVYDDIGYIGFSEKYNFITLAEYREQQINKILE